MDLEKDIKTLKKILAQLANVGSKDSNYIKNKIHDCFSSLQSELNKQNKIHGAGNQYNVVFYLNISIDDFQLAIRLLEKIHSSLVGKNEQQANIQLREEITEMIIDIEKEHESESNFLKKVVSWWERLRKGR